VPYLLWAALASLAISCASTQKHTVADCPIFSEIEAVSVNPAWALDRHLRLEVAFKVCPPVEGLAEIQRKRIEVKHTLIRFLSSKAEAELEDPLRVEILRGEIHRIINEEVMKKGTVDERLYYRHGTAIDQ
jgi:flagellar basal body-associated protein FliL